MIDARAARRVRDDAREAQGIRPARAVARARRARSARHRTTMLLAAALVLGLAGGFAATGIARALWSTGTSVEGATIAAGDLQLSTGGATWRQATPGVPEAERFSGVLDGVTPPGFHSMPGDVVEFVYPITTLLRGENLRGGLALALPASTIQDAAAGRIAVSCSVADSGGDIVAQTDDVGQTLVVPGLVGTDAGATASWTVVVRVDVLGDYDWTAESSPLLDLGEWSLSGLALELRQVRTGEGYRAIGTLP